MLSQGSSIVFVKNVSSALFSVDQLYPWVAGPLGCTEEQHSKLL